MTPREAEILAVLARAGWDGARRSPITLDASARRYERLTAPDGATAILMDEAPDARPGAMRFRVVADHLRALGLSSPRIYRDEAARGLLVLEDFGDDLYFRLLEAGQADEPMLYAAAVDALIELHRHPPPQWAAPYDIALLTERAQFALDWYRAGAAVAATPAETGAFNAALREAFDRVPERHGVLTLRDVHAQNLIWLPEREGLARVGLLDFQDAEAGHPAYDLVSLLSDARRDVPRDLAAAMLERYIARTGTEAEAFRYAAALYGAQRNLRILGGFSRLSMLYAKPRYVDLIPRVWRLLQTDLAHPGLTGLRQVCETLLPAPDDTILQRLKDLCPKTPAA